MRGVSFGNNSNDQSKITHINQKIENYKDYRFSTKKRCHYIDNLQKRTKKEDFCNFI